MSQQIWLVWGWAYPGRRPITAAKLQSKEQLRTETIPTISTRTLMRMAIRQMVAAARSQETQVVEERSRSPACSAPAT
jgi:hypothetical protein